MHRIGPHVSKLETPNEQRAFARQHQWGAIQTFAGPNQTYQLNPDRVSKEEDGQRDVIWVVHSCYPAHFIPGETHGEKNAAYLLNLAKWCKNAGAQYMVVHLGATKGKIPLMVVAKAKAYWAKQGVLQNFLREHKIKLLIENVAAAYPTNQDLRYTVDMTKESPDILGWCLDTAHSNAAGVQYDVLSGIVGNPETAPDIIHCNYPGSKFGSGLDRHGWFYKDETPVDEEIKSLWRHQVQAAYKAGIPLIAEGSSNEGSHTEEVIALRNLVGQTSENSPPLNDAAQLVEAPEEAAG